MDSTKAKVFEKWRRRSVADEITVCWICGQDLVAPRTLPCLHSFCEECLLVLLQAFERKGKLERTFRCPQCKTLVPNYIPEKVCTKWLRMFPSKRSIDNMKDAVNLIEEMCKSCSEKWKIVPATKFCVECQTFFCHSCEADHKSAKDYKRHKLVNYELRDLKHTPAGNISKFHCTQHKNLRFSMYCESHAQFLCNNCMESGQHQYCRVKSDVIDTVRSITKSEAKLHVINHLKHDERNLGKDHVKVIEQIDSIQGQLEELKARQTELYCNYVMQATVTDHKTGAMDALKGKLEFDKNHRTHGPISRTMARVEAILSEFTGIFNDAADDKSIRHDIHKNINDIEKILSRDVTGTKNMVKAEDTLEDKTRAVSEQSHVCWRHVDSAIDDDDVIMFSKAMPSVGRIHYGKMQGTVFRVGSKYVMTAAHTVRDIVDPDRTKDSDWALMEERDVFICFHGSTGKPTENIGILRQVPFLNDELNVAVLELRDLEHLPPPLSLSIKDFQENDSNPVLHIGFRLTDGQVKKFVKSGCNVIIRNSDRASAAAKWLKCEEKKHRCNLILRGKDHSAINWNYDNFKDQTRLTVDLSADYRCSGSPILTTTGNTGLKVIAVLTESAPECFSDLPKKLREMYPSEFMFEVGSKMNSLYSVISTESRCLADDLFLVDERL